MATFIPAEHERVRTIAPQTQPIKFPAGGHVKTADVAGALDMLGIDPRNLVSVHIDLRCITVQRLARDGQGVIVDAAGNPITVTEVHRIVK